MLLKEKIAKIKKSSALTVLPTGTAKDFDGLWANIIEPNLPDENVVVKWHELLKQYVEKQDAIFFIRAFGTPSGNSPLLRRGFINATDHGFSSVFVDNGFTSYFYSMARDGYVPSLSDFEECIKGRSFPCGCFQTEDERKYAAYLKGRNPGVSNKGYKIAHIYSAGKDFNKKSPFASVAALCNKYFPRGVNTEWNAIRTDAYGDFHYRFVDMLSDEAIEARKFLVAHFMRMVHPINYFLVPNKINRYDDATGILKTNILWNDNGVEKDEIGEEQDLINYVEAKIKAKYKTVYDDFLNYIYPIQSNDLISNKVIDAKYGIGIWKTKSNSISATNSKSLSRSSCKKPSVRIHNELADFEAYAAKNGVSNPPYYSSLLKTAMKELTINTIADLEDNIDVMIDACTQKIADAKKAKDELTKKKYSNCRSALRKYSDYLDQKNNTINDDVFLNALEDSMRESDDLSDASIRIYSGKIRELLRNNYTIEQLYSEIDGIIKAYSEDGQFRDPKDHNNTKSALNRVAKMIKHPYIRYKKGFDSFISQNEHIAGYCIENNTITIFYGVGFVDGKQVDKKIPDEDMKELIEILDVAVNNGLFEKSNTNLVSVHGPVSCFDYQYRNMSGTACRGLFVDGKSAQLLQDRYTNLINKLTK